MRPTDPGYDTELYECSGCGVRRESPDTRTCDQCGGRLINISKSRDL